MAPTHPPNRIRIPVHRITKGKQSCSDSHSNSMAVSYTHLDVYKRQVQVYGWGKDYLDIERVGSASPTPQAARAFGAALAHMHDVGAEYFGSAPDGYNGTCYFGPLQDPVKMDTGEWTDPISYFADGRLRPMVNLGVRLSLIHIWWRTCALRSPLPQHQSMRYRFRPIQPARSACRSYRYSFSAPGFKTRTTVRKYTTCLGRG